jgi:hypothetical protein
MIVRRMDYVYGDYELEFVVNGKSWAWVTATEPIESIAGATGRT